MIKGVEIKKLKINSDNRGWLTEVFREDEINHRPVMSYISQTKPDVIRGPHEHQKQSDFFIFLIGKFRLYLWDNREGAKNYRKLKTLDVGYNNPVSVLIPTGVVHAYKCISEYPGLVINLPDKLFKGENKLEEVDEIRWEGRKDSPFIIN